MPSLVTLGPTTFFRMRFFLNLSLAAAMVATFVVDFTHAEMTATRDEGKWQAAQRLVESIVQLGEEEQAASSLPSNSTSTSSTGSEIETDYKVAARYTQDIYALLAGSFSESEIYELLSNAQQQQEIHIDDNRSNSHEMEGDTHHVDDESGGSTDTPTTTSPRPVYKQQQRSLYENGPKRKLDRHAKRILEVANDPECLTHEFYNHYFPKEGDDEKNDDKEEENPELVLDMNEVGRVFAKCRMVVIRNFFDQDLMHDMERSLQRFVTGIWDKTIPNYGRTSLGEKAFIMGRSQSRYELVLPHYMTRPEILGDSRVVQFLQHQEVLGMNSGLLSSGALLAEAGAEQQDWHPDESPLFGAHGIEQLQEQAQNDGDSEDHQTDENRPPPAEVAAEAPTNPHHDSTKRIGGNDATPFAVTMVTPMVNVTHDHGPTQFCMGTSNLLGMDDASVNAVDGADHDLLSMLVRFRGREVPCPARLLRMPLLNQGDVLFFDFNIWHRGGANVSPEMRPIHNAIFARRWFTDRNFDMDHMGEPLEDVYERFTERTRFADIPKVEDDRQEFGTLEEVTNFSEPEEEQAGVWFMNMDVEFVAVFEGENKYLGGVSAGERIELILPLESTLNARNDSGETLRSWKIHSRGQQIYLSNEMITKKS